MAQMIVPLSMGGGGSGGAGYDRNATDIAIMSLDDTATIRWRDPADEHWRDTVLLRKIGSEPRGINDGVQVAVNDQRDRYSTAGYEDGGLPDGVTAWYRLFPRDDSGGVSNNEANDVSVAVAYVYPSALEYFAVVAGDERAVVYYELPGDATGVRVVYKPGGYPADIDDGTVIANAIDGAEITGLANDVAYYFRAFPFNGYGRYNTATGGNQTTATPQEIIPTAIADFAASAGNAKITISFTRPEDATGVRVVLRDDRMPTGPEDGTIYDDAATGQVIDGLANDTTYYLHAYPVNQYGRYNITDAGQTATATPVATTIYGVRWDGSASTAMERTDAAVGITEPVAAVGAGAGSSWFDNRMPWASRRRCNVAGGEISAYEGEAGFSLTTADVMVRTDAFYYQLTAYGNGGFHLRIADGPVDGFRLHEAFDRGITAQPLPYILTARYETSGTQAAQTSRSGIAPLRSVTRANFRTGARNKGARWSQGDYATYSIDQLLMLVEYASLDLQSKIGQGNASTSAVQNCGNTDAMVYHTGRAAGTDGQTAVQYRWVENPWGNIYKFVDGVNVNNRQPHICLNPANYADDTVANYRQLSYSCVATNGYITKVGIDPNLFALLPTAVGGSATAYIPDQYYQGTGWRVVYVGGLYSSGASCGPFSWYAYYAASNASPSFGSRLHYLPL